MSWTETFRRRRNLTERPNPPSGAPYFVLNDAKHVIRLDGHIRCGEDGRGYKMSFPRGWSGKIGVALKIGVLVIAAASDAGEVADLPAPSVAAITTWAEESGARGKPSAEMQGDLVNAAFDALSGALADKANDLIDSAFIDAETKVSFLMGRCPTLLTRVGASPMHWHEVTCVQTMILVGGVFSQSAFRSSNHVTRVIGPSSPR